MKSQTRLLGIDYGTVRIGFAISDPDRILASPLETYTRVSPEKDALHLKKILDSEQIGLIVLGMPIHLNGRVGQKAQEVQQYAQWLKTITDLPILFWDERFTTVEAESALWNAGLTHKQRKSRRDRVAAQVLLQGYIESGCPAEGVLLALDAETSDSQKEDVISEST